MKQSGHNFAQAVTAEIYIQYDIFMTLLDQ